jgi:hypothetical protein
MQTDDADRLSFLDSSFIFLENRTKPMHVGSVAIFEVGNLQKDVALALRATEDVVRTAEERISSTPLNQPIGPHRRFGAAAPLAVGEVRP